MKKNKTFYTVVATFLATSFLWVIVYSSIYTANPVVKKFADAYGIIEKNYILEYDEEFVKDLSITAMVHSLGDKYSTFYNKESYTALMESMSGYYYGIGVTVSVNEETGELYIYDVQEDTPAYRGGISKGDILIKVGDVEVSVENYNQAVSLIKGKENESVTLTFIRESTGNEYTTVVNRERIISKTVEYEVISPDILYIKIIKFDNETATEFLKAVETVGVSNFSRLIIDLRDNGGGTLYSTRLIADMLLPEAVLTTFEYKDGTRQDIKTKDGELISVPICVLVNGNSASASEVLTSALKDNNKAVVVGEKTFGKAIAQKSVDFEKENGKTVSSLYLTYARYLTPSGEDIHEKGITPDYVVSTPEKYKDIPVKEWEKSEDIQLEKAIEILKEQ